PSFRGIFSCGKDGGRERTARREPPRAPEVDEAARAAPRLRRFARRRRRAGHLARGARALGGGAPSGRGLAPAGALELRSPVAAQGAAAPAARGRRGAPRGVARPAGTPRAGGSREAPGRGGHPAERAISLRHPLPLLRGPGPRRDRRAPRGPAGDGEDAPAEGPEDAPRSARPLRRRPGVAARSSAPSRAEVRVGLSDYAKTRRIDHGSRLQTG